MCLHDFHKVYQLTIIGMLITNRGSFLPNLFAMNPNTVFEIRAPIDNSDVIQDASSIVIFPLTNGESSDMSKTIIGLDHPSRIPTKKNEIQR